VSIQTRTGYSTEAALPRTTGAKTTQATQKPEKGNSSNYHMSCIFALWAMYYVTIVYDQNYK
jgi:hypothetical protein